MKKTITINPISVKSIDKAIEEVENYRTQMNRQIKALSDAIERRGAEILREKIAQTTHGQGELAKSISTWSEKIDSSKVRTYIRLNSPYAAYVEFGTGIKGIGVEGESVKHPYADSVGWVHDVNKHGEKGWVYKDDDGEFYWTKGHEANPILYETLQQLKAEFPSIVRGVMSY